MATVQATQEVLWNIGNLPIKWYRVIGQCIDTSQGCAVGPLSFTDGNCGEKSVVIQNETRPPLGTSKFVQIVPARSPGDVCRLLTLSKWIWPIDSIEEYTNGAFSDELEDCNELTLVDFCDLPECYEFCNISSEVGMLMHEEEEEFVSILSTEDETEDTLVAPTTTINTSCSTCNEIALVLNLDHNLGNCANLKDFLTRNGLELPEIFELRYNSLNNSWFCNYHFRGLSNDNLDTTEHWKVVIEWACTSSVADADLGANVWKFSLLITKASAIRNLDAESRVLLIFPADDICEAAEVDGLDFSFSINPQTSFVKPELDIVVEVRLLYDDIGLFKSDFWTSNEINFTLSEAEFAEPVERIDIKPIFPVDPQINQ